MEKRLVSKWLPLALAAALSSSHPAAAADLPAEATPAPAAAADAPPSPASTAAAAPASFAPSSNVVRAKSRLMRTLLFRYQLAPAEAMRARRADAVDLANVSPANRTSSSTSSPYRPASSSAPHRPTVGSNAAVGLTPVYEALPPNRTYDAAACHARFVGVGELHPLRRLHVLRLQADRPGVVVALHAPARVPAVRDRGLREIELAGRVGRRGVLEERVAPLGPEARELRGARVAGRAPEARRRSEPEPLQRRPRAREGLHEEARDAVLAVPDVAVRVGAVHGAVHERDRVRHDTAEIAGLAVDRETEQVFVTRFQTAL
jgi:hypothetical protein